MTIFNLKNVQNVALRMAESTALLADDVLLNGSIRQ
jgi:hypothetical protein